MRQLCEIEAEMAALGRPSMAGTDCGNIKALYGLRVQQAAWAAADPANGRHWDELYAEAQAASAAEEKHRMAVAESSRLLQRLGETVGDIAIEGIPRAIREPREAMRAALDFDKSATWSLTLLGGVGTGKTVPAAWLAKQALERGDTLTWWRAPSLARQSMYGPEADERIKRASESTLFVLDDLGAELTTGPWVAVLEDVLGYRHAHGAKSVVTGNLPLENPDKNIPTLRSLLRDRLFDRLKMGVVIGTGNGSLRNRKAPDARPGAAP